MTMKPMKNDEKTYEKPMKNHEKQRKITGKSL